MTTSSQRPRFLTFALVLLLLGTTATAAERPPTRTAQHDPVGLRLYRPYERGKVPVVLIHGLWGRPEAWDSMVATLENDPTIRPHFQFWTFAYPTGDPITDSAARLSSALRQARERLDPSAEDPALDRPVLVGHSLGGLLAKATALGSDIHLPKPGRLIFIATPHQGSPLAVGLSGRVGVRLLRPVDFGPNHTVASASSIEQLATGSSVLRGLGALHRGQGVPYHSIIADRGLAAPAGTDGIVPYASAHLDGAESEQVVHSGHFCLDQPEVIRQVGRILHGHAAAPTGLSSQVMPIASTVAR